MKLFKEIFKRPVTILFITIIFIALGVLSALNMSINLLPDISFPYLSIKTVYVGADAETVDKNVTIPIENSVESISGIHDLSTYSIDNASIVILQFDYGTNIDTKEKEINDKLNDVSLPSDCEEPEIIKIDLNGTSVFSLSLSSDSKSIDDVTTKAHEIEKSLLSISGVGSVTITGAATKSIAITPINGLELLSGFLVTELVKDNSLDIPLGEIKTSDGKISINNASSAKTTKAIGNMMVSASLSNSYIQAFKSIQSTIEGIENMNLEDLVNMKSDCDDMLKFINELETKTDSELDDINSGIRTIKSLVETIENNTAAGLQIMWNQVLKSLVEDETFKSLSEDELHQMADKYNVSYDVLKWLQDNAVVDPDTIPDGVDPSKIDSSGYLLDDEGNRVKQVAKTYAEVKWGKIVKFRETYTDTDYPDGITPILYADLFYDIEVIPSDTSDPDYKTPDEISDSVKLSKNINTVVLDDIVDKLKKNEVIENSEYAELFATATRNYDVPLTSYTIKMIRDSHFDSNYQIFYDYKVSNGFYTEQDDDGNDVIKGNKISSADFMKLYNQMEFDEPFELKPTERLIEFIRNADFTSSTIKFRINEVADVTLESVYESKAYYNGKEAIQIDIYGNSGCNTTSIAKEAKNAILKFNGANPDYNAVMLNNQADFISSSLSNALVSLLIGMVLAILVIYLFLRKVKSSVIIAISMPLSVLMTLGCLYLMGITLNMVSVGGLAVGIGMLVDNSIVVLESITSERSKGKNVLDASIEGVRLVFGSLVGSTLTSICVFFPILCINGLTREIFADLSWAVIFSLTFSLVVAVVVIPTLFCFFYKNEKIESEEKTDGKLFTKLKNFYANTLTKALRHKGVLILCAMGIFLASIGLIFTCSIEFLPSIDQRKIEVNVDFSTSDEPEACQAKTLEAYNLIRDNIPNIKYAALSVGFGGMIVTDQTGTILLEFTDKAKKTSIIVEDIRELLANNNYSQSYSVVEQDGVVASLVGGMNGVSVTIKGDNVDTLKEIANKIEKDVMTKKGIKNASDNMLESSTSYTLEFNKDKLAEKAVDYQSLVQTLRIGLAGYTVSTIDDKETELNVDVKFNSSAIGDYYDSLAKFIVGFDDDNDVIYLEDVCNIKEESGRHVIRKDNGKNMITITVESYGIDTNTASSHLKNSASTVLKDYDGYTFSSGGVSAYLTDAFTGLVIALVISFFLLFGIMACLFESLRKPCIIIFSFPFAFTGGFIALAITRVSLNVVSFIGLIMLMGVIINDAIVLNERIDQVRETGISPQEAVILGCKERLRAVLMTTLTTVLALIPMALGIGDGGALMQPLGIVAIGGMTVGTVVTLFLIPSVYSVFYRIKFKKEEKSEEENMIVETIEEDKKVE